MTASARYVLPSVVLNSDADEEGLVLARAWAEDQAHRRAGVRKFAGALAFMGIGAAALLAGIAGALLPLAVGGGCGVVLGLVLLGLACRDYSNKLEGLTRASWNIAVLRDEPDDASTAVVVWDKLAAAPLALRAIDVAALVPVPEILAVATGGDELAAEATLMGGLAQALSWLDLPLVVEPSGLVPRTSPLAPILAALMKRMQSLPEVGGVPTLPLRLVRTQGNKAIRQGWERFRSFTNADVGERAQSLSDAASAACQRALNALPAVARPAVRAAASGADPRPGIQSALTGLFAAVLAPLESEASEPMEEIEQKAAREKREAIAAADDNVARIRRDRQSEKNQFESDLREREDELRRNEREQTKTRREIARYGGLAQSATRTDIERRISEMEQRIIWLRNERLNAINANRRPTDQFDFVAPEVDASHQEERVLVDRLDNLRVCASDLARSEERHQELKVEMGRLQSDVARARQELASLDRDRDPDLQREIAEIDRRADARRKKGRAHIDELEKRRAALAQLSRHADATAPTVGDASAGPALSDTFLTMRRDALHTAQQSISAKVADIRRVQAEAVALRQSLRWRAEIAPAAPAEYAIPFWFVKWRRERDWRPLIGPCEAVEKPGDATTPRRCVLAPGKYGPLLAALAAISFSADHSTRLYAGSMLASPERLRAALAACDGVVPAGWLSAGDVAEMRRRLEPAPRTMQAR
jgi:hypothetical protein